MGFKEVVSLDTDKTTALGGRNKEGKNNPTKLEGYYVGSKDVASQMSKTGLAKLHVFQTKEGSIGVWGKTDLDRKMLSAQPGAMTRVTFTGLGEPRPGKKPMYKFKVEQDTENCIEVNQDSNEEPANEYADNAEADEVNNSFDEPTEESFDEEEAPADEIQTRAPAPKKPAVAPTAAAQSKIQGLLNKRKVG